MKLSSQGCGKDLRGVRGGEKYNQIQLYEKHFHLTDYERSDLLCLSANFSLTVSRFECMIWV